MNFGLCGGHRTGKTTLAQAIANQKNIPFIKTDTSAVFRKFGLDPALPMDFSTRLHIQHKVLEAAIAIWEHKLTKIYLILQIRW
jgi:AAA+ superfamily predicted ATPase